MIRRANRLVHNINLMFAAEESHVITTVMATLLAQGENNHCLSIPQVMTAALVGVEALERKAQAAESK